MEFGEPLAFTLAALALPMLVFAVWRGESRGVLLPSGAGLLDARPSMRLRAARAVPLLRVLALLAVVTAIARPRIGEVEAVVPAEGIDIALSLDISSSMAADLGGETRLEATKRVIRDFIKGRENDRIGFAVFARDAIALAPPSLDYDALDRIVADTDIGLLPDGTGIGVGLGAAINMLVDSNAASRIVVLLTDGQHNADSITPLDAADLATAKRMRVYTIGVYDASRGAGELDEKLLQQIADETGGRYFIAGTAAELTAVYEEIASLETSRVGREEFEQYDELGPWFLAAAAGLVALELLLAASVLRRPA